MGNFFLFFLFLISTSLIDRVVGKRMTKRPPSQATISPETVERIKVRLNSISKAQWETSKIAAVKAIEGNLLKAMLVLGDKKRKDIPKTVQNDAKTVAESLKKGELSSSLMELLPPILTKSRRGSADNGNVRETRRVLDLMSTRPSRTSVDIPLSGISIFLKKSLSGANVTVIKLLQGLPSALNGVVESMVGNLGILGATGSASVDNIGPLIGVLLGDLAG